MTPPRFYVTFMWHIYHMNNKVTCHVNILVLYFLFLLFPPLCIFLLFFLFGRAVTTGRRGGSHAVRHEGRGRSSASYGTGSGALAEEKRRDKGWRLISWTGGNTSRRHKTAGDREASLAVAARETRELDEATPPPCVELPRPPYIYIYMPWFSKICLGDLLSAFFTSLSSMPAQAGDPNWRTIAIDGCHAELYVYI